jgi:GNAT superfamily N-acetyltransferase
MLEIRSARQNPTPYLDVPGFAITPEQLARQKPDELLVAVEAGAVRARCGLWFQQTPPWPGERLGLVGHYFAADEAAAVALLTAGCERLAGEGCTRAVGPMDGSTWYRYRLVTERGDEPPYFLEPDNPDDWPGHFLRAGFTPLAHYHSARAEELDVRDPRCADAGRRLAESGVRFRPFDPEGFEGELRRIHAVSLACFADNFLFTPIAEEDFLALYVPLRPALRPELFPLAERDGRLVGFLFGVPDFLPQRRGRPVDAVIIKTLAVHPECQGLGLGGYLMDGLHQTAHAAGYRSVIHALMHDDKPIGRLSRRSARVIRRYALYGQPLDA